LQLEVSLQKILILLKTTLALESESKPAAAPKLAVKEPSAELAKATSEKETLAKPATRSIVKTEAPAPAAGKSVAVRSIAAENTDLALALESESKPAAAPKLAVKESSAGRAIKLSKANEQKQVKKALSAKAESSSKSACGGYAYGGCYDLTLKPSFKFREELKIESAADSRSADTNKNASAKMLRSKLVQKVVSQDTKKTLAGLKQDVTTSFKEMSSSNANKEVREKSVQLALLSFQATEEIPVEMNSRNPSSKGNSSGDEGNY